MSEHYADHWEEKFASRAWGRYPPEDLVRFMGRNYKHADRSAVRVLEVGCGPGANVWFLHREGFAVSAIDISPTGIALCAKRLEDENAGLHTVAPDLKVGNFQTLPWEDATFDVVVDIFAIYANTLEVIESALSEVARVLKPNGRFYAKLWGRESTGYGSGDRLEEGTYDNIPTGPCADMGVSHFYDRAEIESLFSKYFTLDAIDRVLREDAATGSVIEEFHCSFTKGK